MANQGFVRVPQIADDILRNAVPEDEMPTWDDTMRVIAEHMENKSTTKYGAGKSALFPTADQIAEVKAFLQTIPESEEARSFCPKSLQGDGGVQKTGRNDPAAQWRYGKKEKFRLDEFGLVWATGDTKGGYVVPREQIHNVLVWAHRQTMHGGRDTMYALIKDHYCESSFSKAFISDWSACCGLQKCQKKSRGARIGMTPPVKKTVKRTVNRQQIQSRPAPAPVPVPAPVPAPAAAAAPVFGGGFLSDPAYGVRQPMPDDDLIANWDDTGDWAEAIDRADRGLEIPEAFRGVLTRADLPDYLPVKKPIPPTAVDAEGNLQFDMDQFVDFSGGFMDSEPDLGP
ncbi:hypothetical protein MMC15_004699 [Xylographa vitiligo]|nr:hypothetical protein [Xylographa vitiligo]